MTQEEFLLDTLEYYNTPDKICKKNDKCRYSPVSLGLEGKTDGCAIGRWLDNELKLELDSGYFQSVSNVQIFTYLPDWMQELGITFLDAVQALHDNHLPITTEKGRAKLNYIINYFDMDKSKFEKYLK